jgi:hypothetical protein
MCERQQPKAPDSEERGDAGPQPLNQGGQNLQAPADQEEQWKDEVLQKAGAVLKALKKKLRS